MFLNESKIKHLPVYKCKWQNFTSVNDELWKIIFRVCFKSILDNSVAWFQYKILFNILPTRDYLHKIKLSDHNTSQQSDNYVFQSNPQYLNFHAWCLEWTTPRTKLLCGSGRENCCPSKVRYLYQDLNRRPSTIDGYRTAIVNTLGPVGLQISKSSDLNRLLPKVPEIFQNGTFLFCLMSSQKHPQTSYSQNCFLASLGLRQAPQQNSCLGCKQSI